MSGCPPIFSVSFGWLTVE